ncbi:hypothetical protein BaRGS_00003165 [Batillaria attramentaria]|uniref:Uncharacterized protein n=1 Tax=Batillaria attramentaria TaxID=370345 RepID=A0ABD0M0U6_9CAEN
MQRNNQDCEGLLDMHYSLFFSGILLKNNPQRHRTDAFLFFRFFQQLRSKLRATQLYGSCHYTCTRQAAASTLSEIYAMEDATPVAAVLFKCVSVLSQLVF